VSKEGAAIEARQRLESRAEELLNTAAKRIEVAQVTAGDDPDARKAAADAVVAADEAELEALAAASREADEALGATVQTYTFRPLGWKAWRALIAKHPPKDKTHRFDLDSIAPTILRLASYEPRLSAEQVEELLESDSFSEGEIDLLLNAAIAAQT